MALSFTLATNSKLPLRLFDQKGYDRYSRLEAMRPDDNRIVNTGCHIWRGSFSASFIEAFDRCAEKHGRALLVIGDSRAIDLYNAIATNSAYPFIAGVSRGRCRAHVELEKRSRCPGQYEDLLTFVSQRPANISLIVYTQAGTPLYTGKMTEFTRQDQLSLGAIGEVVAYLKQLQERSGVTVLLVGPMPPIAVDPQRFSWRKPVEQQISDAYSKHFLKSHKTRRGKLPQVGGGC